MDAQKPIDYYLMFSGLVTRHIALVQQRDEIDREVTDKAPAVGLFTPKRLDFVSKRVGNFKFNRQFNWMITQSWVQ